MVMSPRIRGPVLGAHPPSIPLSKNKPSLGGGNSNIFYFHPDPWGDDPIWLYNIFQMGWFNHQPVLSWLIPPSGLTDPRLTFSFWSKIRSRPTSRTDRPFFSPKGSVFWFREGRDPEIFFGEIDWLVKCLGTIWPDSLEVLDPYTRGHEKWHQPPNFSHYFSGKWGPQNDPTFASSLVLQKKVAFNDTCTHHIAFQPNFGFRVAQLQEWCFLNLLFSVDAGGCWSVIF